MKHNYFQSRIMSLFFGTAKSSSDTSENTEENSGEDILPESGGDTTQTGQVALDVLENHESVFILAPVAGIELRDIDISVHETTLTISGVRSKPQEFFDPNMQIKNSECFWGNFKRSIILPDNMDFSAIKAVMENNLLVISIPKIRFDSKSVKIDKVFS